MKQLMLGNAAVARGLYEEGCSIVSSYPGTPSTEITEETAKFKEIYCEWAPNEKVALESAFGASLAGKRAFCGMKHVGLNVAADPLFTIAYTGVNAGLIIGVADDPGMHSSQNEQDSRHHAIASKIPMVEPSDSQEAKDFVKIAYELSEKFDTPVLYKMCKPFNLVKSVIFIIVLFVVVFLNYICLYQPNFFLSKIVNDLLKLSWPSGGTPEQLINTLMLFLMILLVNPVMSIMENLLQSIKKVKI